MSEALPHPEDPSRWPLDPWIVLGVSRTADRREVRRAYAKLIRIYRPEHKPDEFRRVRDAYERIDGFLEFRETDGAEPVFNSPATTARRDESSAGALANRSQGADERAVDQLWGDAAASTESLAAAYGAYRTMLQRCPQDEELVIRVYWLLRLWPNLDDAAEACGLLAEAITRRCGGRRTVELYRREVQRMPEEALSERMLQAIRESFSPQQRLELLALRWQAASRLGRRKIIAADLKWAKADFEEGNPEAWLRTVLLAMDHLAWELEGYLKEVYQACRRETADPSKGQVHLEYELDRTEYLAELASQWRRLKVSDDLGDRFPPLLPDLIEQSWTEPLSCIRLPLLMLLARWTAAPMDAMDELDELGNCAPTVLHRLAGLVDVLYRDRCDPNRSPSAASLVSDVRTLLWTSRKENYARRKALAFCLRHRVTSEVLAETIAGVLAKDSLLVSRMGEGVSCDMVLALMAKAALAVWPETHGDAGAGQGGRP